MASVVSALGIESGSETNARLHDQYESIVHTIVQLFLPRPSALIARDRDLNLHFGNFLTFRRKIYVKQNRDRH